MSTKGDLINSAYTEMRISGITSQPTPEDLNVALERLEDMAARWAKKNICTGYNFEDIPDPNSPTNLDRGFRRAYVVNLAWFLCASFGKQPHPSLALEKRTTYSDLASATAKLKQVAPPSRQPLGSGTTLKWGSDWFRYYRQGEEAPTSCATNNMIIGNINDYTEHFDAYLDSGEDILVYSIEADTGLAITSQSQTLTDINYTVRADGSTNSQTNTLQQVLIVITTTNGRVETRVVNFTLTSAPEIA